MGHVGTDGEASGGPEDQPGEARVIARTAQPLTRERLVEQLRALGVGQGQTVLVHTSLSALGWVCGGPVTVIEGLMDLLTPAGTLVMPAHSGALSDPAGWANPPVPEGWWEEIRATMPAFDPDRTPTRAMGQTAELFRTWPGVLRSHHPAFSFAAWGRNARYVTEQHALDDGLGEGSPLARLYELDAYVLLLGVGYDVNTSFHLGEYRTRGPKKRVVQGAPIVEGGRRVWKAYHDIELDADRFEALGADFEAAHRVRVGPVGAGTARFFRQRPAVDFAAGWLEEHPA